jgi:hypothetical protein
MFVKEQSKQYQQSACEPRASLMPQIRDFLAVTASVSGRCLQEGELLKPARAHLTQQYIAILPSLSEQPRLAAKTSA